MQIVDNKNDSISTQQNFSRKESAMTTAIESEIAGTVWKIEVAAGDSVSADDVLIILESMKMEIPVMALSDGVVESIHVAEGDSVSEGQLLVSLR
jgi:biotin carboxyl carrier protein